MILRKTSVDFDGSQNGDPRFGFLRNRVPGVEANPTTVLRNFYEQRPVGPCYHRRQHTYDCCIVYFHDLWRHQSATTIFILLSNENARPTQRTPSYVIPFITAPRPSCIPGPSSHYITSGSLVSSSARHRLLAFILLSGLIPSAFVQTLHL